MMNMFNDVRFKNKTINNNTLSSVDPDINDIRLALINSINNIHLEMQQVKTNGVQGFTGRYEGFSNYSNIEGLKALIDEKTYWHFLECLPPLRWNGDTFYLSEFLTGDLTLKFWIEDNKYFCQVAKLILTPEEEGYF